MPCQVLKIHITTDFEKSYKKLPKQIRQFAEIKDKKFRLNAFDPSLKTHKLKGELDGFYSYSVNYQYRILFRFINSSEVIYYDIGTHGIYN
jgi:addiction module RelE/StbE family toxin